MKGTRIISLILLAIVLPLLINAQDIRVSLFYNQLTESFTFHCIDGEYLMMSQEEEIMHLKKGDILFIRMDEKMISVNSNDQNIGEFKSLHFRDLLYNGRFMLRSVQPSTTQRLYMGELEVSEQHGVIKLITTLEFDHYLAGAVEAEAGPGAPGEFFKVQAILCRTYAVRSWERHTNEGFNLCDDVHCQVFHGIADDNPGILDAVLSTHGVVVTDKNYGLISAAFHGNSGGETQRADDIWPGNHEYLLPIIDEFSENQPGAKWVKKISVETWKNYLLSRGISIEGKSDDQLLIRQDHRKAQFIVGKDTLRIPEVREDFKLRSSYFSMELEGNEIVVNGKGYGHGIGLSQEGAMEMARKGYSYMDILNFYYYGIRILDLNQLPVVNVPEAFR